MTDASPLAGIRVVELSTGIAGAYATKLFADAGADVIKVEPPGGDPLRRWSSSGSPPPGEDGALFRHLCASKRSVEGELGDPAVERAVASADLIVQGPDPLLAGTGDPAHDEWERSHPGLVVVSITPFGRTGPWRDRPASEFTVQAECGAISVRGRPDQAPLQAGGHIGEWAAGAFAAPAALAALRHARRTGRGALLDLSVAEVTCICTNLFLDLMWGLLGRPPVGGPARMIEFPSIEPSSDGWVAFNTNSAQMFEDFLLMIERPDLQGDPGLRNDPARRVEVERATRAWTTQRSTAEIVELASLLRVAVAPVGNGANLLTQEHLVARNVFRPSPDGTFTQPVPPFLIGGHRLVGAGPAPALGQHNGEVVGGRAGERRAVAADAADALPLSSLRVLDLTCWWAGPGATQLLAALGADVIHVESVQRIDGMRPAATLVFADRDQWWEYSSFFLNINVNKRGVTLNLDDPRGQELARRLVCWADVVVENYTPRVVEQFGLDWTAVHDANPRAVMVRMPAFGLDGPWRDHVGFAQTIEAMSGMAWVTGYPDGPPVIPRGPGDPIGAVHAAFAILAALETRDRTGEGELVEAPLIEAALNVAAEQVVEFSAYGEVLQRRGNRSPFAAPQGLYPCAGEDAWLALSVRDDIEWDGLRRAIGDPEWARDPELATHEGRARHHDRVDSELSAWSTSRRLSEAVDVLVAHGVPAGAVVDHRQVSTHPHLVGRGFFETSEHPVVGAQPMFGMPFRWSGINRWIRSPAPTLGQHNREVLGGLLGLSDEEIAALEADHVIGQRPLGV
ncbi:MAG TPA: CoA transferase [Acidimicrobiales bacterium]|nr:CoA transferase [Acidimicrobiales bacterium]